MSTTTIQATALGYVDSVDASGWSHSVACAMQGSRRSQWGKMRVGAVMFGGLFDGPDWSDAVISGITLAVTFGSDGKNAVKTLKLWTATRSTLGGTGSQMRGDAIGDVRTNVAAKSRSDSLVFSSSSNASAFEKLKSWLRARASTGLCLYVSEYPDSGEDYSDDYLSITAAAITVEWEPVGSAGVIAPASVDVGGAVALTVTPITGEGVITHAATYKCGSASSGARSLASGVTSDSYTIPQAWAAQISGTRGDAVCTLDTYEGGTLKGSRDLPFEVTIPDGWAPTLGSFSVERYASRVNDQGVTEYYASLAGGYVWVNLAATMTRVAGVNVGSCIIRYWPEDDETSVQSVDLSSRWTGDALTLSQDRTAITAAVPIGSAYVFECVVSNGHTSERATATVNISWAPVHVSGTGRGVGIGMYSGASANDPRLESAWPAYLYGGVEELAVEWTQLDTSGAASGIGALCVGRVGDHVYLRGGVNCAQGTAFELGAEFAPAANVHKLVPCAGARIAQLFVWADAESGSAYMRVENVWALSNGGNYTSALWIDCNVDWWR